MSNTGPRAHSAPYAAATPEAGSGQKAGPAGGTLHEEIAGKLPESLPDRLGAALKRFASALDHLEAAANRRGGSAKSRANLEDELAVMEDDRSRLAVELDGALARNAALTLAHDEIRQRLDKASQAVATVLERAGEAVSGHTQD